MEDRKNQEHLREDDIRRKVMKKSIKIEDLIKDKYFQTLFGSYCLYMQVCEPLAVDTYVENQMSQFPKNIDLLRSFLEFMNEDQAANSGFSKNLSTFDMSLASKQLSSGLKRK